MKKAPSDHRPYARMGYAALILGFGGFIAWASLAEISAAVVAPGSVTVVSNRKVIQHLEGGIVHEVMVRDGSSVAEGEILVRLDRTMAEAELEVLRGQMDAGLALQARLEAERDGLAGIAFPQGMPASGRPSSIAAMRSQESVFEARRQSLSSLEEMLTRRIDSHRVRAEAYRKQAESISAEIDSYREQLDGVSSLASKGFASRSSERDIERRILSLQTSASEAEAGIAAAESAVAEAELEKVLASQRMREEAVAELAKALETNAALSERIAVATDTLARAEIKAPEAGVVQALKFHARGAVIRAGEPIMELVPVGDELVIETHFPAVSIDQVRQGMEAEIRFPSFSSRTTPILTGRVESLSPDAVADTEGTRHSFAGRIEVLPDSIPDDLIDRIQPGMPAEVVVATEDRTVLSYLLRPLTDALARTFRER